MAEKRGWMLFGRFWLFFSIFVGLVALVIGLLSYFGKEKAEVTAQVLACDELTTYHPELEAKFTYAGEEVMHLWKLKVNFVNSGDKTIVGEGNQANILGEGLNFVFPDGTRVLRVEEETDTFECSIVQTNSNEFQIQFSQWRSGEYMIGSFYVASEQPLTVDPCPAVPSRDIIDGDTIVENLTEKGPEERMSLIDRLPTGMSMFGKIMGLVILAIFAIVGVIFVGTGWKPALRLRKWKARNLGSFIKYLDQVEPPLSDEDKQGFKKQPYRLPEELWANFEGEKVPVKRPSFDSIPEVIYFTFAVLIIASGSVIAILALIAA